MVGYNEIGWKLLSRAPCLPPSKSADTVNIGGSNGNQTPKTVSVNPYALNKILSFWFQTQYNTILLIYR